MFLENMRKYPQVLPKRYWFIFRSVFVLYCMNIADNKQAQEQKKSLKERLWNYYHKSEGNGNTCIML